jgi:diguanylate cyclase (GGDEF)-like protein
MPSPEERRRRVEVIDLLDELRHAHEHHYHWLVDCHRELMCVTPDAVGLEDPEAHHHCRFGRWYDEAVKFFHLEGDELFRKVGAIHQDMHIAARDLLHEARRAMPVSTQVYDHFAGRLHYFQAEVFRVEQYLWRTICLTDPLTGLRNRQGMMVELRDEMARSQRKGLPCIIGLIDLDHFKRINDEHDHMTGDRVLRWVADYLCDHMRTYDKLFRYGGEEFLFCLPSTDMDSARAILERLRTGLASRSFLLDEEKRLQLTISIGAVNAENQLVEDAILNADRKLLQAKQEGRNRLVM